MALGNETRAGTGDGTLRPPWVDHRLQKAPPKPWRKIHLD